MTGVLIPAATEAEWLARRREGITASDIAPLMGLAPASWDSPYSLYHRKLGLLPDMQDNEAMALGRYLETYIADRFAALHPEFLMYGTGRELYHREGCEWQMATPDRLLAEDICRCGAHDTGQPGDVVCTCLPDPVAGLETKTSASYEDWGDDGTDVIPVHYRCQVLWNMLVAGLTTWYVACLFLHSRRLRVYIITLGDAEIADLKIMADEAAMFRMQLAARQPPDIDWYPATRDALKHLHPSVEDRDVPITSQLAGWYTAACRNLKAAERRKALYENRIRALLGTGRRAVDPGRGGQVIARRDVYDLAEKTILRKASTVDRLVPVKQKAGPS